MRGCFGEFFYLPNMKFITILLFWLAAMASTAQQMATDQRTLQMTLDPVDTSNPADVTLGDVKVWLCTGLYANNAVVARLSKPIASAGLTIKGARVILTGDTHQFLIEADTAGGNRAVVFNVKEVTKSLPVEFLPKPSLIPVFGDTELTSLTIRLSAPRPDTKLRFKLDRMTHEGEGCLPELGKVTIQCELSQIQGTAAKAVKQFYHDEFIDLEPFLSTAKPGGKIMIDIHHYKIGNSPAYKWNGERFLTIQLVQ
jgi:hypothetical protein